MMGDSKDENTIKNTTTRESLVNTAVQFLKNQNTQMSPLTAKTEFLKKKGLTDEEIGIAVQRSGVSAMPSNNQIRILSGPPTTIYPQNYYPHSGNIIAIPSPPSRLIWLRDVANTIVALGGTGYLILYLYKKYIVPYLFGTKKKDEKKDPVETEIIKLKKDVSEIIERVDNNVKRLEQKFDLSLQKMQCDDQELVSQITSLKGLLLNRKQFPATPLLPTSSTSAASIPSWQLSEIQSASSINCDSDNKKLENSPTNSSKHSFSNDNGSDSSLEIIKVQEISSNNNNNNVINNTENSGNSK